LNLEKVDPRDEEKIGADLGPRKRERKKFQTQGRKSKTCKRCKRMHKKGKAKPGRTRELRAREGKTTLGRKGFHGGAESFQEREVPLGRGSWKESMLEN